MIPRLPVAGMQLPVRDIIIARRDKSPFGVRPLLECAAARGLSHRDARLRRFWLL